MSKPVNPQWLVDRFPNDLKAQVRYLVSKGYQVIHQETGSAQLLKKKSFSCLFCLITGIIPYGIWYMAKRDKTIYLDASDQKPTPPKERNAARGKLGELYDRFGIAGIVAVVIGGFLLLALIGSFLPPTPPSLTSATSTAATSTP
jgi:hypothetical protein